MTGVRRQIARIVEKHLDDVLDRVMTAYEAEIPAVAAAPEQIKRRVRESTRRATVAFLALYGDPESPARQVLNEARDATIDRAGEMFEREDILSMIRVGRQVIYQTAREYVRAQMSVDQSLETEIDEALASFMRELERAEETLPQTEDALHHLLVTAETEEPDLA